MEKLGKQAEERIYIQAFHGKTRTNNKPKTTGNKEQNDGETDNHYIQQLTKNERNTRAVYIQEANKLNKIRYKLTTNTTGDRKWHKSPWQGTENATKTRKSLFVRRAITLILTPQNCKNKTNKKTLSFKKVSSILRIKSKIKKVKVFLHWMCWFRPHCQLQSCPYILYKTPVIHNYWLRNSHSCKVTLLTSLGKGKMHKI